MPWLTRARDAFGVYLRSLANPRAAAVQAA